MTKTAVKSKVILDPLRDRVIIKKDTPEEASAGGIIIPEVARAKPMTGTIIAVGPGIMTSSGHLRKTTVKVGDKAIFEKYEGMNPKIQGEEFFIIPEINILATYSANGIKSPKQ